MENCILKTGGKSVNWEEGEEFEYNREMIVKKLEFWLLESDEN